MDKFHVELTVYYKVNLSAVHDAWSDLIVETAINIIGIAEFLDRLHYIRMI